MVEFLQNLLIKQDKEIKIDASEVLDEFLGFSDSLSITDTVGSINTNSPPYTWAGGANDFEWGFATWS